jgi:hypothetical protein
MLKKGAEVNNTSYQNKSAAEFSQQKTAAEDSSKG